MAKGAVSEYAPAQFEVNLGHVADPLRAADQAFLLKRAIKAAARAEGLRATFMAKPFADRAANGLHVHVSLADRRGGNRFAADEQSLGHAIGGLQATMAEAMLLFAPNANSFRRLRPLSYAPLAPTETIRADLPHLTLHGDPRLMSEGERAQAAALLKEALAKLAPSAKTPRGQRAKAKAASEQVAGTSTPLLAEPKV